MKRRDFILNGAGAMFLASAGRVLGAGAPSNRVRLAFAGCHENGRGISLLKSTMMIPGVEIAYVCDVDSRAMDFAADLVEKATQFKPRKEADLRKIVEDPLIDGVILETPDHWHAYGAVLAMNAGKAVYVEKPCAFCPSECEVLINVQRKTGAVFQMGNQRRASLSYKEAIEFVRNENPIGELKWAKCWYTANRASIGKGKVVNVPSWLNWDLWQGPAPRRAFRDNVVHYKWHWFRHWGTAETGNNAPHFADAARWALGVDYPEIVQTIAQTTSPRDDDYEWPDTYNSSFKYPNNKMITFELTSRVNGNPYMGVSTGAMIYGERGSLFFTPGDTAILFNEKSKKIKEWKAGGSTQEGSLTNPTSALDMRHMTKFVECIRAKNTCTNSPVEEAVKSTLLPLLANIAADTGESIRLDPKTGKLLTKVEEKYWSREYEKGWDLMV